MPPGSAVGLVNPLTLATGDVREALMDPKLVLLPEAERVGVRPARVHATDEEWNKIGAELLHIETAREDAPVVEQMPVGGEWLHSALQSDEIVFWSSDDIHGCFHIFSLPPAWRRWMILSKPIRVALPAGKVRVLASSDQLSRGGNAPQHVVSDGSRLIWLAPAVIPMGWLSAVRVTQHLRRNIISYGRFPRVGLRPNAEFVQGKPFPVM